MKQMVIYESILDDMKNTGSNAAGSIAQSSEISSDDILKRPGMNGWSFQFIIKCPLTIAENDSNWKDRARECIKSKEAVEEVLRMKRWISEYSQVWIQSVPISKDLVIDDTIIHGTQTGGGTYLRFSLSGRPRNTMDALYFMLAIIQCVRPAYDEKSQYNKQDYMSVAYKDDSVLGGINRTTFEYFDEFYFLLMKKPFLFEWTREANKSNYPWTIFRRLLGFVSVLLPGTAEPYYRLRQMFCDVLDDFTPEVYNLSQCESFIFDSSYAYGPGRPGEIKLTKPYRNFLTSHPIDITKLEKSQFGNNGFCLICPSDRRDKIEVASIYEFNRPLKPMDNFIREKQVDAILNKCNHKIPENVWLKLFKKQKYLFIALYVGTYAPDEGHGPVDVYVGVRHLAAYVDDFYKSLNLLYDDALPEEFYDYFEQTITRKL